MRFLHLFPDAPGAGPALRPGWRTGLVAAESFLLLDRDIIRLCGLLICDSDPAESAGVRAELGYAGEFALPVFYTWNIDACHLTGMAAVLARTATRGELADGCWELVRVRGPVTAAGDLCQLNTPCMR